MTYFSIEFSGMNQVDRRVKDLDDLNIKIQYLKLLSNNNERGYTKLDSNVLCRNDKPRRIIGSHLIYVIIASHHQGS